MMSAVWSGICWVWIGGIEVDRLRDRLCPTEAQTWPEDDRAPRWCSWRKNRPDMFPIRWRGRDLRGTPCDPTAPPHTGCDLHEDCRQVRSLAIECAHERGLWCAL
jgi:hypothetical protein